MEPLNFECDLQSLRTLYSLLLSNANKESTHQAFLLDEYTQFLLKRLLDSATEELLNRQSKILAQVQLGLPERVSTRSPKNSVSRGIIKLPSKAGLTEEVVDSIERIDTQLSAFRFCSSRVVSRDDRTKSSSSSKSPMVEDYSSFQRLNEKALMERRQSYQASVSGVRSNSYMPTSRKMSQTTRASNIAPSLTSVNHNAAIATVRSRHGRTLPLQSRGSCAPDDQFVVVRSRPPLPPRPLRSVGFEKPSQSSRTSLKMASMKPTLLDQGTETWDEEESGNSRSGTSSEGEEEFSSEQESEEASGETGSTSGSSWETHGESVTESGSSYPSESGDDDNSRVRSRDPAKQRKKVTGRFKRLKEKLGKVFHHHHHHYHHNLNKEEQGLKPSAWKRLVKTHLQKDKEKLVERRMKSESKGLTTRKNKGGQFHALVEGVMRHHRRRSKKKKQTLQSHGRKMNWWQTPRRQAGVKFPNRGRVKLGKTNYLCSKEN